MIRDRALMLQSKYALRGDIARKESHRTLQSDLSLEGAAHVT